MLPVYRITFAGLLVCKVTTFCNYRQMFVRKTATTSRNLTFIISFYERLEVMPQVFERPDNALPEMCVVSKDQQCDQEDDEGNSQKNAKRDERCLVLSQLTIVQPAIKDFDECLIIHNLKQFKADGGDDVARAQLRGLAVDVQAAVTDAGVLTLVEEVVELQLEVSALQFQLGRGITKPVDVDLRFC